MRLKIIFIVIILIVYRNITSGHNILIQDINKKYDLSRNRANCMLQDSKGFLWFGMVNGLYKFDLNSFTKYSLRESNFSGFPELDIKAIIEFAPGKLMVGGSKGLYIFDSERETYDSINCSASLAFSGLTVQSICASGKSSFWIGTNQGLFNIAIKNKETLEFEVIRLFNSSNSNLHSSDVLEIRKAADETIWFLTTSDLAYFNKRTQSVVTFSSYRANASIVFDGNRIIQSCFGDGVYLFNTSTFSWENVDPSSLLVHTKLRYTYKDSRGKFWLSISNVGLILMDSISQNKDLQVITNKSEPYTSLNSNVIYKIFESDDGAIWLCTEEGINMITYKPDIFHAETFQSNINNELTVGVRALFNSNNQTLWFGTLGDGLFRQDLKTKSYVKVPLKSNGAETGKTVQVIIEDNFGNLWIGTEGDGVIKINQSEKFKQNPEITNYRIYPRSFPRVSMLNDFVMCLLQDKQNNIWIGTWYGLSLLEHTELLKNNQAEIQIRNFINNPADKYSISNNTIMSIIEDSDGNVWIGTHAGINKIEFTSGGIQFINNFRNEKGDDITHIRVLDLFQDKQGSIWFSKQDGGIGQLNTKTGIFKEYNASNGFHDYIINSITQDNSGILWLGTNTGLCRFDPVNMTYKMYYTEDGLLSNDFFFRSGCMVNNQIYLGGNKGITSFNPSEIIPEEVVPKLVFTNFNLFNEPVPIDRKKSPLKKHISYTEQLALRYNQNYITIGFAALNFNHQQEIQYMCILEGLEGSWNKLNSERKITYTNLKPGKYLFKVRAVTTGHKGSFSEISMPVLVRPPFWRTIVALLFYIILVVAIIVYSHRFFLMAERRKHALALERINAKRLHEMDMMKLQFYTNVSHELRTPLTLISAPLETLLNEQVDKEKARSYYQLMHKNVQRLRRMINQLLDMRKIEEGHFKMEWAQGDVVDFVRRVFTNFETYAEKRNILFSFQSPEKSLYTFFDADKLEKVLFNLLSNAFKYTPDKGTISLVFQTFEDVKEPGFEDGYYLLQIRDTGFGIPQESIRNIYKPFHQVKKNKPIGSAGSGIGLSLTKELVKLQMGDISVESEVDKGSVFTVKLPVVKAIPAESQVKNMSDEQHEDILKAEDQQSDTGDPQSKSLVLVVEDDAELRGFICGELGTHHRVIEAANGIEGFNKAVETIPDLVISDVMMDEMDGIDMCRKIKEDIRTSHIPVILLTARHSEEIMQNSFGIGADDYITKPFQVSLLNTRIANLIEQRRNLRKLFGIGISSDLSDVIASKPDSKFIEKLNSIIEKNIDNPDFSPVSLASDLAMSKMQLYRKVAAITNQTVYNYIRTFRLTRAARLLISTDMQIAEVAYAVGFSEASNFTKTFIKHFNQTPSQYVREHRPKE